jgi:hypothetical protein
MITILIVIAVIMAVIIIAALIIGTKMTIEKIITIDKPIMQVFDYLKFVKNQDNFSIWNMTDPEMKKDFRGTDGTQGFIYSWDSSKNKNVGAGEQEITSIDEGKSIEYEIRFFRPMPNVAKSSFVFTSVTDKQTNVQWGFYSKMKFPMNIMKPLFHHMLGKDLEKGLLNLKALLEKK